MGICEALQGPGQDRPQGSVRSKVLGIFPESRAGVWGDVICPEGCRKLL